MNAVSLPSAQPAAEPQQPPATLSSPVAVRQPRLGDDVWIVGGGKPTQQYHAGVILAAKITGVHGNGTVDLIVWPAQSMSHYAPVGVKYSDQGEPGTWHWPQG